MTSETTQSATSLSLTKPLKLREPPTPSTFWLASAGRSLPSSRRRHTARYPAPEHLNASDLVGRRDDALVLLPDTLSSVDGQMVAGFREGAQALRVRARQEGVPVEVVVPEGARAGH